MFQYNYLPVEAYRSPYAQAIAGAIGGADRAHAVATEQTGQIAATAATNIGAVVGALPQQIAKGRDEAQRAQMTALAVKAGGLDLREKQKKLDDDETMARIYRGAYGQAAAQQPGFQGPTQPGDPPAGAPSAGVDGLPPGMVKGADGVVTIKPDYLTNAMAQAGMGDKIPGVMANLTKMNESMATLAETRGKIAIQTRDALGSIGATVDAAGNTASAFHTAALLAIHNGVITPDQIKPYLDAVDANPATVAGITKALQSGSPKQTELNTAAATAAARATTAARPTAASLANDAAGGDPATATTLLHPRPPMPLQSRTVLLDGQPAEVIFNPATGTYQQDGVAVAAARVRPFTDPVALARFRETVRHNRITEDPLGIGGAAPAAPAAGPAAGGGPSAPASGAAPTSVAAPGPGSAAAPAASGSRHEEALAKLPPPVAAQVRAIVDGKRQLDPRTASTPAGRQLLALAYAYDPSFDQVNYNARAKTRTDFTSGASAKNVNALNTVIGHLSELSDAADALHNTWSPTWNSLANAVSTGAGNPAVKQFETVQNAVADEATRVWRQAGGTESDIKSWKHDLDAAGSPEQLHGVIATIGDLLSSKLEALQTQYQQGMGASDIHVITPAAEQALALLRGRSAKPGAAAVTAGAAGAGPKNGDQKPLDGNGAVAEFRDGRWIRIK